MNEEKRIGVFYNGETGETVERQLTPEEIAELTTGSTSNENAE